MQTKNFIITKERIAKLRDGTPSTNTGYIKVPEKDLFMLYDMLDEIIDSNP